MDYAFSRIFRRRSPLFGHLRNMRALMYVWAVNSLAEDFRPVLAERAEKRCK